LCHSLRMHGHRHGESLHRECAGVVLPVHVQLSRVSCGLAS
jgi:hypothetical protein